MCCTPLIRNLAEYLSCYTNSDDYTIQHPPGFIRIGGGSFRSTFTHPAVPDVVFKVPKWDNNCCEDEFNYFWFKATHRQQKYLARPIYLSRDKRVVVMEKVETFGCSREQFQLVVKLFPTERRWDLSLTRNLGTTSYGTLKIFDYSEDDECW